MRFYGNDNDILATMPFPRGTIQDQISHTLGSLDQTDESQCVISKKIPCPTIIPRLPISLVILSLMATTWLIKIPIHFPDKNTISLTKYVQNVGFSSGF